MKIFAIMLVKNEADIIESVILNAKEWADRIFIMDNGSTDGTWEICRSLADSIVVPWRQDFRQYSNGLRADVFNEFRKESTDGDWWCFKLDADEFYYENPRLFLSRLPNNVHLVSKKSLDYVLTKEDVEEYDFGKTFELNRENIKYLKPQCWQEPRFFKYRESIKWPFDVTSHYPKNIGILCSDTILVKHYQYRSPRQIQARLDLRNSLDNKKNGICFKHVKEKSYEELLENRVDCLYDEGSFDFYKNKLKIRNILKQSWFKKLFLRVGIRLGFF